MIVAVKYYLNYTSQGDIQTEIDRFGRVFPITKQVNAYTSSTYSWRVHPLIEQVRLRQKVTCITDLPDCHVHGVCNIYISSIVHCMPFWMVHPCFSWLPIHMTIVPFRRTSYKLGPAICRLPSISIKIWEKKARKLNLLWDLIAFG